MRTQASRRSRVRRQRLVSLALCMVAAIATLILISSAPQAGHAEQEAGRAHFEAGWNIVSAPSATELRGTSGPQYSYGADGTGYTAVQFGEIISGRAVWAFFPAPSDQPLGRTASNYTRMILPANQWALIGNPSSTQTLPILGADAAETFDPVQNGYADVSTLKPGQGAWVLRFSAGAVTVGTPGSDAATQRAAQVQGELMANPTSRSVLDEVASVGGELVQSRNYDAAQAESDNFRAAFEEGIRSQGGTPLSELTPRQVQAYQNARNDLAQAQEAVSAGNSAAADGAVAQALQEGQAAQNDAVAQASGQPTATPAPASVLSYDSVRTPASLSAYGTLIRLSFLSAGLGMRVSDQYWNAASTLLSGGTLARPVTVTATVTQTTQPAQTVVPTQTPNTTPVTRLVDVEPQSGPAGSIIAILGQGFTPGQIATITFGQGFLGSIPVAQDGTFSGSARVPNVPPGVYQISVSTPADGAVTVSFFVTGSIVTTMTPTATATTTHTCVPSTVGFCR